MRLGKMIFETVNRMVLLRLHERSEERQQNAHRLRLKETVEIFIIDKCSVQFGFQPDSLLLFWSWINVATFCWVNALRQGLF